jgi:undecaprenyl-diphosphatase
MPGSRVTVCCAAVSVLEAVVLGVVQGLTEFIPVSSSGHLVVVPALFGWDRPGLAFDVLLHFASLLALFVYFFDDLRRLVHGVIRGDEPARPLALLLLIGSIPAGLAGVLLGSFFEARFEDPPTVALSLLLTALILVGAERMLRRHRRRAEAAGGRLRAIADLGPADATAVGMAQALALLPGISRSGSTIGTGLLLGMERSDAARFAFLLAIPALLGAAVVQLPDLGGSGLGAGAGAAGFLASAVSSYAAISGLLRYLRSNTLYPFAAYCVVAGISYRLLLL